jgi:entericidin B
MARKILLTLTAGVMALSITACNTVRGAGADLESAADATEEAIND